MSADIFEGMPMAERVAVLREKISAAADKAGRNPSDILLCAVCKTRDSETVKKSAALPVDLFGENHAQELVSHISDGAYLGKPVHFIGHLQTNKVKKVVGNAAVIESVDSLKLLLEINRESEKKGIVQDILFEINAGREESKSGIMSEDLFTLCEEAQKLKSISVKGLMTIPPADASETNTRRFFSQIRMVIREIPYVLINYKIDKRS